METYTYITFTFLEGYNVRIYSTPKVISNLKYYRYVYYIFDPGTLKNVYAARRSIDNT